MLIIANRFVIPDELEKRLLRIAKTRAYLNALVNVLFLVADYPERIKEKMLYAARWSEYDFSRQGDRKFNIELSIEGTSGVHFSLLVGLVKNNPKQLLLLDFSARQNMAAAGSTNSEATRKFERDEARKALVERVRTLEDNLEVNLWYATNRKPLADPATSQLMDYGNEQDQQLHYGCCKVHVPKSHQIGEQPPGFWQRFIKWKGRRIKIRKCVELERDCFWPLLQEGEANQKGDRTALIYVHGFNVSFRESALMAAQLAVDLRATDEVAFFSWPSVGGVGGYVADAEAIQNSVKALALFISDFCAKARCNRLSLLAHSMGNRGVLRALELLQLRSKSVNQFIHQLILAAPDVEIGEYSDLIPIGRSCAQRVTNYASRTDRALLVSRRVNQRDRAGLIPPVSVMRGVDTVDTSDIVDTWLGHGFVRSARPVLQDVHALLVFDAPPSKRFGLRQERTSKGRSYWVVRP